MRSPFPSRLRADSRSPTRPQPSVNVYGPAGLRSFLRFSFAATQVQLGGLYACHELLAPGDMPTSCQPADMHLNEAPGHDLVAGADGLWRDILAPSPASSSSAPSSLQVSAGPILHRVPTLGYTFGYPRSARSLPSSYMPALKAHDLPPSLLGKMMQTGDSIILPDGTELPHPGWENGARIAVLGDTSDATGMAPLAQQVDLCARPALLPPHHRRLLTPLPAVRPLERRSGSFTRRPTRTYPSRPMTRPRSPTGRRRCASSRPGVGTRRRTSLGPLHAPSALATSS